MIHEFYRDRMFSDILTTSSSVELKDANVYFEVRVSSGGTLLAAEITNEIKQAITGALAKYEKHMPEPQPMFQPTIRSDRSYLSQVPPGYITQQHNTVPVIPENFSFISREFLKKIIDIAKENEVDTTDIKALTKFIAEIDVTELVRNEENNESPPFKLITQMEKSLVNHDVKNPVIRLEKTIGSVVFSRLIGKIEYPVFKFRVRDKEYSIDFGEIAKEADEYVKELAEKVKS